MKLTVAYHGGSRYDITSGAHRVVTDQPIEDGGQDAGMSPVELFVGSLAGCVGYFVGRYCDRHQISTKGLSVGAEWTMAEQPHRVGQVTCRDSLAASRHGGTKRAAPQSGAWLHRTSIHRGAYKRGDRTQFPSHWREAIVKEEPASRSLLWRIWSMCRRG